MPWLLRPTTSRSDADVVVASTELSYGQDIADLRNERTTLAAADLLTAGFSCKPFSCEGSSLQ